MNVNNLQDRLRQLPSVDTLLSDAGGHALVTSYGHAAVADALRDTLNETRQALLSGETVSLELNPLLSRAEEKLEARFAPTLHPVINATGVIIHTNLGRALLSKSARQAMDAVAAAYNTLEYNLKQGKRGSRLIHAAELLREITGVEDALVVNNNAAATVLILSALARDREVLVSRGQLVEIGGGFRVPDIMAQSGARLVEVGTTNRTRIQDYERAITEDTALLLRVHSSNFKLVGFTEEAPLDAMAELAHQHNLLLVDDLGSGTLIDTAPFGLDHEPMVQESLAAGADVVSFSGDKLLGGPQAGILVGKSDSIGQLKRHPLARAIRADKLCLAALSATLDHYRRDEVFEQVPVWWMIARPLENLRETAKCWRDALTDVISPEKMVVIDGESTVGGGSLPGTTLPTALLALEVSRPDEFSEALRRAKTAVIARIANEQVLIDPRTVLPEQENILLDGIRFAAQAVSKSL